MLQFSPDLLSAMAFFQSLRNGQLHWKNIQIRQRFARAIYAHIVSRYQFYVGKYPLSSIGKQAAAQGKLAGGPLSLGGRRPKRNPRWPIDMFLELSRSVIHYSHGKEGALHDFYIDPSKRHPDPSTPRPGHTGYPRGVPYPLLAYWIEYPQQYTIRMSVRQIAYLNMVRDGTAGRRRKRGKHGRGYLPDRKVQNAQIVVKLPNRPVWRDVAQSITQLFMENYLTPLFKALAEEAVKYGAKIG